MHRVKVPSDGSLSARVEAIDTATVRIHPAAGLTLPDGTLNGWTLLPAGVTVRSQRGTLVELADAALLEVGQPIRFEQPLEQPIDAPRLALHLVTGTALDRTLPPMELRLSTTRGTNALLQRRGAKVGVLVSDGLSGLVEIGDQTREDLFARVPTRSHALAYGVRAIAERTLSDGTLDARASACEIEHAVDALIREGCETLVVSLAHALTNNRETEIARLAATRGVPALSAATLAPHGRLLTRTETACIHAQIAPILDAFVADAVRSAQNARAYLFTSAGVLQSSERFVARDTLFSGPAGGARAVASIAQRHGIARAVGFDMGGTSSDVTRCVHGAIALRSESRIGRATVAAPSVAIDSVAAGGGSICRVRDGVFEVGPESAGSHPGPACYGRGGPLTISDINLLAGRFASDFESLSLDRTASLRALDAVIAQRGCSRETAIAAFLDIANARMALAIETLCVRDAVDPRGHVLVAFGGAGGQHACAIALRLGLTEIVFPRFAGFLCAQGVFDAEPARFETTPILLPLVGSSATLARVRDETLTRARAALDADGFTADAANTRFVEECTVALRLLGQESTIEVLYADEPTLAAQFRERFIALFGYPPPARAVELVSLRARVALTETASPQCSTDAASSRKRVAPSSVVRRADLTAQDEIVGPTLIVDVGETVVLEAGWQATVGSGGDLVAVRTNSHTTAQRSSEAEQELFAARLESIALAMGHVLERTALSANIRDRLDFSCAVLDADGTLVQNAPHLPVHLGALGICVRSVLQVLELNEGDIAVTNHPAFGGSHLPDVTTIAPVFADGQRVGFVAVRAHHAEIGGTRPGSFPPDAKSLAEEGVVLPPFYAVRAGTFDLDACRARLVDAPFPSRNPEENLADLTAQIAATRHGVHQVHALAGELGVEVFRRRCEGELTRADAALRKALAHWGPCEVSSRRQLDDGAAICVRVTNDPGSDAPLTINFTGSAPTHRGNFNAPRAVTQAAVLYALRLFIDAPVPMNEGLLRAVRLEIPEGLLHPNFTADPTNCPPVVAGNVETSQSVVAALIDALGIAAESQSTMNNVLFGDASFGVYETLGGGAGAGSSADGASAVHVHMSNTRLTDIDVLERRAPVIVRRFEMRKGSGGDGAHHGGDGMVRAYEFRRAVSLSFFGSRRRFAPQGIDGGLNGACGTQHACVNGQDVLCEGPVHALELSAGDTFTVETPGGGGCGTP